MEYKVISNQSINQSINQSFNFVEFKVFCIKRQRVYNLLALFREIPLPQILVNYIMTFKYFYLLLSSQTFFSEWQLLMKLSIKHSNKFFFLLLSQYMDIPYYN